MNDKIKTFLSLSNIEQRGIIGLVLIILFLFIGRILFERQAAKRLSSLQYEVLAEMEKLENPQSNNLAETTTEVAPSIELFTFDPNSSTKDDFIRLGLSEQVASTIINYRAKGGHFYQQGDLLKIYGLQEEDYYRIAPYIQIAQKEPSNFNIEPTGKEQSSYHAESPAVYPKKDLTLSIEINSADSSQLTSVKGIGPVYASRIVKYRNLLGGFTQKEQLLEVYGITPEVYTNIQGQLTCEALVKPIKVHTAKWVDLKSHPYISNDLANLILNYIQSHGKMDSLGVLLDLDILEKEDYQKLKPYLSFEK